MKNNIVALLLVAALFMMALLPSGVHLQLCIGQDGHQDISAGYCASSPVPIQAGHGQSVGPCFGGDHHEDCSDGYIGCGEDKLFLAGRTFVANYHVAASALLPALCDAYNASAAFTDKFSAAFPFNEPQPLISKTVRSVVLLT